MSTNADAWQAGIDATILDNSISKGDFADAIRTVATTNNNADVIAWIDDIAIGWEGIGIINNPTFASLRNEIVTEGAVVSRAQFESLQTLVNAMASSDPINEALRILELRSERDQVDANILTMTSFKPGENRQVREALSLGINDLRAYKQSLTDQLQAIDNV